MTMDMNFVIIQLIGAIGYTLLSISFYRKSKRQILFLQIIANIFFTIHYFLLSGTTGAISNVIGIITYTAIYLFDKFNFKVAKNIITVIMLAIMLIITIINYDNIYSVLPFIAFMFTITSFLNGKEDVIRKIGIISAICWLIYAIVYDSYVAIVFETIVLFATFFSIMYSKRDQKSGKS